VGREVNENPPSNDGRDVGRDVGQLLGRLDGLYVLVGFEVGSLAG
jgi:tetrahydromethanopterin S-methyltransferase subunit G